jgi:hypothetical protein
LLLGLISSAVAEDHQASPATGPSGPGIDALVTNGLLRLEANGAPLGEVLLAIGKAGAFEVVLRGGFATPVYETIADRPLEDAILSLVGDHSVVVVHDDQDSASAVAGLAEIRVVENPALAASEDATSPDPWRDGAEAGQDDADEAPMDRETFRLANLALPPPTREDILVELSDPDQAARVAAIPKVGSLSPRKAVAILSDIFAQDEDPLVRSRAVAALTRLEGPGVRSLLRDWALADEDAELRMQALNALASSRGNRSINILGQALRQDREPDVRLVAIEALGRVGGERARRALARARDLDPAISLAAEETLAAWPDDSPD